jgi:hypothetical protein
VKSIAEVIQSFCFVRAVRPLGEVVHYTLAVCGPFLWPESAGHNAANDGMQVIALRTKPIPQ